MVHTFNRFFVCVHAPGACQELRSIAWRIGGQGLSLGMQHTEHVWAHTEVPLGMQNPHVWAHTEHTLRCLGLDTPSSGVCWPAQVSPCDVIYQPGDFVIHYSGAFGRTAYYTNNTFYKRPYAKLFRFVSGLFQSNVSRSAGPDSI